MKELLDYARAFNASDIILNCIRSKFKAEDVKNLSEAEHIIDFLIAKRFESLEWASYDLLRKKAEKWIRLLNANVKTIDEEYGTDIKTVLDFENGFRFVKLISEKAYRREGALMSHCVASYFGKEKDIYSLRDEFNKPHCTIEKDVQIKGKGNGIINTKYIDYIVRFLEWSGMEVRDSEMENLGYVVATFPEYIQNKLYKNKYISKDETPLYSDKVIIFTDLEEAVEYQGDKICLFDGNAHFKNYKIRNLGKIKGISGDAYFTNSEIANLSQLEYVGRDAAFGESKVIDLGKLEYVGRDVSFTNSIVANLGALEYVGRDAFFGGSKIKKLGALKYIGGSAYFANNLVTNLGVLKTIGGSAYFRNSKIANLGALEYVGRDVSFTNSKIANLGALEYVGRDAFFGGSNITDFGQLKTIGRDAYFINSEFADPGQLKYIEGSAFFANSIVANLGQLEYIGGSADFRYSNIENLRKLKSIGGRIYFEENEEIF